MDIASFIIRYAPPQALILLPKYLRSKNILLEALEEPSPIIPHGFKQQMAARYIIHNTTSGSLIVSQVDPPTQLETADDVQSKKSQMLLNGAAGSSTIQSEDTGKCNSFHMVLASSHYLRTAIDSMPRTPSQHEGTLNIRLVASPLVSRRGPGKNGESPEKPSKNLVPEVLQRRLSRRTISRIPRAAVAQWLRFQPWQACHEFEVPLKTRRVGQRCTLNLSRAKFPLVWCGS
ncbi:hypothetical protein TNCV_3398651 [Trichonephila clavipes]|nr:hypothetical protein TNCV_3398651 [Trichonephila clavipes]